MAWFNNFKIRMKMLLGFGLVIVLMVLIILFAISRLSATESVYNSVLDFPVQSSNTVRDFRTDSRDMQRLTATLAAHAGLGDIEVIDELYKEAISSFNSAVVHLNRFISIAARTASLTETDRGAQINKAQALIDLLTDYKNTALEGVAAAALATDYDTALQILMDNDSSLVTIRAATADIITAVTKTADDGIDDARAQAADTLLLLLILSVAVVVVSLLLSIVIASVISKPIIRLIGMVDDVASGNLNVNIDHASNDETGILADNMRRLVKVFRTLLDDLTHMSDEHDKGDIDVFLQSDTFTGEYRSVAEKINYMVLTHINTKKSVVAVYNEMADGQFDAQLERLPGKKVFLNEAIDHMRAKLKTVNNEINSMVTAAIAGDLSNRADASAYKGDWARVIGGLNDLMDTVSTPAAEISKVMRRVAQGDFSSKMIGDYQGDFLEQKEAINVTITNIASYIEEIADVLTRMSQNDLNVQITRDYIGDFTTIKNAMNNIIETFNTVIGQIATASDQVASGARSISENAMSLATGATEQAASVQQLGATVQLISENTEHNAENAKSAEALSNHSKENASKGDRDMKKMLASIAGIKESSTQISKIIKVIEDIAFQTNLLALNAAVEAARAGEHGKGFAVVSDEVRSLASRSQSAAKETTELIEESISRVEQGTQIADQTAQALRTIVNDVDEVAGLITSIASASSEQAEAVKQVVQGLQQITGVVQNNSATSEEAASASQELSSQSEVMRNLVSVFKMKQ